DHARTRCQRSLDPWLGFEAQSICFFGHETRADHDGGVRRVGTRRDRRDDYITVGEVKLSTSILRWDRLSVFARERLLEMQLEFTLHIGEQNAVLRALGASQGRLDFAEVELDARAVLNLVVVVSPETVELGISFDLLEQRLVATCQTHILDG